MRFLKLLLFIVLLSTSGQLFAGINIQGLEYNLDGSEKSAVAVGLSGDQTDIVVPGSVIFNGNEYAVVRVKGDIFQNSKVTSVTFSEDFNGEIDDENSPFFENCSELVSVVWPRNLDSVPWCCFKNCQKLKSVSWSNTIRTIGSQAFQDCTSLESISLPDSLKTIEWDTFNNCTSLQKITIPPSVENIENDAFLGCSFLSFRIEDGMTNIVLNNIGCTVQDLYIGRKPLHNSWDWGSSLNLVSLTIAKAAGIAEGFCNCTTLKSTTLLVDTIANNAFQGCSALENVTFSATLDSIGEYAFSATGITEVSIPVSAVHLGNGIFENCQTLSSVQLFDGMTEIPNGIFWGCVSLSTIKLPTTVKSIGGGAFSNSGLSTVSLPAGLQTIGSAAFSDCKIDSIVIPDGVRKIEESTFFSCKSLKAIVLSKNIESVGDAAFHNLKNLHVYYNGTLKDWCRTKFLVSGYPEDTNPLSNASHFFVTDDTKLERYHLVTDLVIPAGVDSIPAYAFTCFKGFQSIEIPSTVKYVGNDAFSFCKFTSAIIRCETIKEAAFSACSKLKKLTLGQNFKRAENSAFYFAGYSYITYEGTLEQWCKIVWDKGSKPGSWSLTIQGEELKHLVVPYTVQRILPYAFSDCQGIETVYISQNTRFVDKSAFSQCQYLKKLVWKKKGETRSTSQQVSEGSFIDESAFASCSRLASVELPDNLLHIGNYAFAYNDSLASISLPGNLTTIGDNAFCDCSKLDNIQGFSHLQKIGTGAFDGTKWLERQADGIVYVGNVLYSYKGVIPSNTHIVVKDDCVSIAGEAFAYNLLNENKNTLGLESITIPNSVTFIGQGAFSGCTGLKEVNLPASLESLEAYTFSGCSSLAQITLPQGVKTVYGDAFKATAIRNLSIPNSVLTLTTIYGDSLRTLRLEDGTDSLHVEGNSWIVDTDSLENLYYGRNLAEYKLHHSWKFKTLEIGKYIEDLVSQIVFSADTIGKIYVYRNIPPVCQMTTSVYNPWLDIYVDRVLSALNLTDKELTTLYVPQGSLDAYAHAEVWKDFIDVQEFVPSGISSVMTTEGETVIAHYDLSGCRIPSDKKGLHIVKYTNGTSKKVVIP